MYQDNQSDILLEKNGKASSSKRTKYLNIRYLFSPTESRRVTFILYIVSGTIFNMKATLLDLVGDKNIPDVQMFSSLGTGSSSVVLEENC